MTIEPLGPAELGAIRTVHRPTAHGATPDDVCEYDGHAWPCTVARLLATLDAATPAARADTVDRVRSTHGHQFDPPEWLDGGTINIGQAPPDLHPAVVELRQALDLHARMIDMLTALAQGVVVRSGDLPTQEARDLVDEWHHHRTR